MSNIILTDTSKPFFTSPSSYSIAGWNALIAGSQNNMKTE